MEKLHMCRICLNKDVRLHCLVNTNLQEIYELLTGHLLETKDIRPLHACEICCARLRYCLRLRTACLHSEQLFYHLLENDSCEVTQSQGMNTLQTTPVMNINLDPVVYWELQVEPPPMTNEQLNNEHVGDLPDNIMNQGMCTQFIKQEDMKSENLSSKDEELDYSIQNIKVEVNSASDNSSEHGTPERYVSNSNQSISSVDGKDILGDKTVKIVLHRRDLNSFRKGATVTQHHNPTDLEYTSQCNNLNYSENVEMLEPNICEKYKQIVHTSSETHCTPNSDSFKDIRTHTRKKPFRCPTCDKCFSCNSNLTKHIRTHTGKKPYKCDTCGKGFCEKSNLSRHNRIHTGEKPYKCDICGNRFRQWRALSIHIRTHTGENPYKCDTCGKCFSQWSCLSIHMRSHTGEKPYKCDTCGICFARKDSLSQHIPTHTGDKPYKCDICGKGFCKMNNLSRHIRIHTDEKPFKCVTCGECFREWGVLSKHILTHTGEKPYKCDTCGKCFSQWGGLSIHMRLHTGEKPYKCDTCGIGFRRKGHLSEHIRIHTGEKPYKCDTCGKCFRQGSALSIHIRSHTGGKPYKCDTCGKSFNRKNRFLCHIRTHTHTV